MLAIVTGVNSGMGRATVAALADKEENPNRMIKLMLCDLGNYSSIRNFVNEFKVEC